LTYSPPTPWQLYASLAASWSRAGAGAFDCIEAIAAILAAAKLKPGRADGAAIETGELTWTSWESIYRQLAGSLDLPEGYGDMRRFAERAPGLLEESRMVLAPAFPVIASPKAAEYVRSLIDFLVYAPQTGLRHTPVGYFKWPDYLAPLLQGLLGKPGKQRLYCPLDSSGWMPLMLAAAGWKVDCEVANDQSARVFKLLAFAAGWDLGARVGDPVRRPVWLDGAQLRRYKHAAAITNFGLRLKEGMDADPYNRFPVRFHYGEALQLAHVIAQTNGRVVIIVPEALLFRTSGGERDYKEQLIRRGILSAVIRLPRDVFVPYAHVQSSILILETDAHENNVLFVDPTDDLGRKQLKSGIGADGAVHELCAAVEKRRASRVTAIATYDEIAAQDFNISVDRYVRSEEDRQIASVLEETKTFDLADIAEIIRPQAISGDKQGAVVSFAEVSLQDVLPDGTIRHPNKRVHVDDLAQAKAMRMRLQAGDVLLSVRGRIGTVGIVPERKSDDSPNEWLASQAFVILRLRDSSSITPLILYRYLSSPFGQGLLNSLATGMTVPMVSMGDLKKLRVMIPSAEEQREVEQQYEKVRKLRAQVAQLEKLADELNAAGWPMTKSIDTKTRNKVR
jgi:type I restriction enzyme M protein